MRRVHTTLAAFAIALCGTMPAFAQTTVVLPDTSQTTTISVSVSEQARIVVPSGIVFAVTNINTETNAAPATIAFDQVVLSSATRQIRLSLQATSGAFAPPAPGDTTWVAGDVSWNAPSWVAATSAAGTLSHSTFNTIATCTPGATACSTTGLVFTLASKPAVQRSGTHTLVVAWKVESIGS